VHRASLSHPPGRRNPRTALPAAPDTC
jgi:hypothetical protein